MMNDLQDSDTFLMFKPHYSSDLKDQNNVSTIVDDISRKHFHFTITQELKISLPPTDIYSCELLNISLS